MLELHVWGSTPESHAVSFDADCLAASWLLGATVGKGNYVVVQSSNVELADKRVLPVLREVSGDIPTNIAEGIDSIARWLRNCGYEIDGQLPQNLESDRIALWYFVSTQVTAMTAWIQFVNNDNYVQVTRPLISQLVPFPLQYNIASGLRKNGKDVCYAAGLLSRNVEDDEDDPLADKRQSSALSRLHDDLDTRKMREERLLEGAKETMRVTSFARKVYGSLLSKGRLDDRYLFGNVPSSTDLLLLAHLRIQLSDTFASNPLLDLVQREFPLLKSYVEDWSKLERSLRPEIRDPRWQDRNNLIASVARAVGYA
jgi:hypothetical protein